MVDGGIAWSSVIVAAAVIAFVVLLVVVARDVRRRARDGLGLADAIQKPSPAKAVLLVILLVCAGAIYYLEN